jgi:hypothetical protein
MVLANPATNIRRAKKILAIIDNNGFVLAPLPVAPVNEAGTVLLPERLNALKRMARLAALKIGGSYLNLDGGFNSGHNRNAIFNAGLIPNIKPTRAIARPRSADGSGCSTPPFIRCDCAWNGPLHGRINSNDCCYGSSSSSGGTMA